MSGKPGRPRRRSDSGPPDTRAAFGYARDSGGPSQERSVGDQQQALQEFADRAGYVITEWYRDVARTGRNEEREEFQRLITDAIRTRPAAVLVWDMARFARDQDAAQFYRSLLRRSGVQVISLNDQIPDGPLARIVESVIDFSSEHYSKTLAQNVKRGQRAMLARGYVPGSRTPVGCLAVREELGRKRTGEVRYGRRLVPDEAVAPLVRRAFEMRVAGAGIKAIMGETGLTATRQGMLALLSNPIYKGVYVYGGEEWPGIMTPIVDEALWQAAQQTPKIHSRTRGASYLLSGLLRCGQCGFAMNGNRATVRQKNGRVWTRRYYLCINRNTRLAECRAPMVHADALEADVLEQVLTAFLAPEPFGRFVAAVRADLQSDAQVARAAQLDRQIAAGETVLRGIVDLLGRGVAVEVVAEKLKLQEAELRELRRLRAELGNPAPLLTISEAELQAFVTGLRDRLITGSIDEQRAVLHEVIERIAFGPELVIQYRLPHG